MPPGAQFPKDARAPLDVAEVLGVILGKVCHLLNPTSWSLVLRAEDGELYVKSCSGPGTGSLCEKRFPLGEGIAGKVFLNGIPRLAGEVELSFDTSETTPAHAGSLMVVPLRTRLGTLGVLQLERRRGETPFSAVDLAALTGLSEFVSIALENAHVVQKLQELSITDDHTGLYNARHLRETLDREVARASRFRRNLSLLFLDLDGFKQVNDSHGHLVGSALLREVGSVLTRHVRQVDLCFRYGGDEFAVVLLETGVEGARRVGLRLRDQLRAHSLLGGSGLGVRLTASLGGATFPDHCLGAQELLEKADQAMYRVKASGRDDVLLAEASGDDCRTF